MRHNLPVTATAYTLADGEMLVSVTDPQGRITCCNPVFVRISGYSAAELLGQPHNLVRHPDMPEEAFRDMWDAIQGGRPWTGLVKNRCRNGDFDWVPANAAPLTDGDRITGHLSMRTRPDPTEVQQALATVRSVSALLGEISSGARHQEQGIGQVNRSIVQIDGFIQQNAAMVEQLAASAQALGAQFDGVHNSMRLFRLQADAPSLGALDAVALRRLGATAEA